MKVVILHPPLYPVNHQLFNIIGKEVELVVYSFGEQPGLHQDWKVDNYNKTESSYTLNVLKGKTNLKRLAVSYSLQMNPFLMRHLINEKPDIVISVAFWMPSFYSSILKSLLGFKLLIITDAISATEKNISKYRVFLRRFILKNSSIVLSGSDLTTSYIKSLEKNVRTELSLQTIDVASWQTKIDELPSKVELRKELGLPVNKQILLGVGSFIELKNWMSVYLQLPKLDNCFFILIGEGKELNSYQDYIIKHSLQSQTLILEKQFGITLKKYFKVADLFLFPSQRDTFGYVVTEALCSGVPVICSENAGASSLIKNNKNGFVVSPNGSYFTQIERVLNDLPMFSVGAKQSMVGFTLENKAKKLIDIFNKVNDGII
jgi:glycosyltransferase involved in cell wall biosynthesis